MQGWVLLCADSEKSFVNGQGKTYQVKIFKIQTDSYLAYAGDRDFIKEFVSTLKRKTVGKTGRKFLALARKCYKDFRREHYTNLPKDEKASASILVTARADRVLLYHGTRGYWFPVDEYQPIGLDEDAGELLFHPIYNTSLSTAEMGYMAIYALLRIKGFVHGCGRTTQVRELLDDPNLIPWPRWLTGATVERIEKDCEFFKQATYPLISAFADRAVSKETFRATLSDFAKKLKAHRAEVLRRHEPIKWGTWLMERSSNQPSALPT